jgi:hypothetical protein
MRIHIVRRNEHLSQIASRFGVSAAEVWDHPRNGDLRRRRRDPNVLAPGDVLLIPKPPRRDPVRIAHKGSTHFTLPPEPTVTVTIRLRDEHGEFRGEAFDVRLRGARPEDPPLCEGTTGGSGEVVFDVPVSIHEVVLRVPGRSYATVVYVGGLDPAATESGIRARLRHLGFLRPSRPGLEAQAFEDAVRRFQAEQGLAVTGRMDADTAARLQDEHRS